ncbi:MAG TPA: HD domain-containing phosphohydrolase [Thermaerobacter sp.]
MVRLPLDLVPAGAILARTIYAASGQPILRAGHPLTGPVLERLHSFDVEWVWIEDPAFAGLNPSEPLQPATWLRLRQLLRDIATDLSAGRRDWLPAPRRAALMELAGQVLEELEALREPHLPYPAGRDPLDRWVAGTVNRMVLATRLALAGPYHRHARDFVLAALLQDLGAWTQPGGAPAPACHPLARGERGHEEAEKHVARSLRLLSGLELGGLVRALVAQHHERLDGSGYPEGLRGQEVHPAAQRMGAAVAFALAVEGCAHRPPLLPHEAYEWLLAEAGHLYDRQVLIELNQVLFPYPVGSLVEVDGRYWAVVVDCQGARRLRPRVRLLATGAGQGNAGREIDLLEQRTGAITGCILDAGAAGRCPAPGSGGGQG